MIKIIAIIKITKIPTKIPIHIGLSKFAAIPPESDSGSVCEIGGSIKIF